MLLLSISWGAYEREDHWEAEELSPFHIDIPCYLSFLINHPPEVGFEVFFPTEYQFCSL
jgi:hypothetical protein